MSETEELVRSFHLLVSSLPEVPDQLRLITSAQAHFSSGSLQPYRRLDPCPVKNKDYQWAWRRRRSIKIAPPLWVLCSRKHRPLARISHTLDSSHGSANTAALWGVSYLLGRALQHFQNPRSKLCRFALSQLASGAKLPRLDLLDMYEFTCLLQRSHSESESLYGWNEQQRAF